LPRRRGHLNRIRRAHQIRPAVTGRDRPDLIGKAFQTGCSRVMSYRNLPAVSHPRRLSERSWNRTFARSLHFLYSVVHHLSTGRACCQSFFCCFNIISI